jgi:hypothetical protein
MLATLSRENLPANTWHMSLIDDLAFHLAQTDSFERELMRIEKKKAESLILLYDSDNLDRGAIPFDYSETRERTVNKRKLFSE